MFAASARSLAGDVLTLSFGNESDVASFREPQGAGESVSEQLRAAIHEVLGIRVKFLARVDAEPAAAADPAPDREPDPEVDRAPESAAPQPGAAPEAARASETAAEWNVVAIPQGDDPTPAEPNAPTSAEPLPEASADPSDSDLTDTRPRYGEAVVREILGAHFLEEQSLAPRERPVGFDPE